MVIIGMEIMKMKKAMVEVEAVGGITVTMMEEAVKEVMVEELEWVSEHHECNTASECSECNSVTERRECNSARARRVQ